MRDLNEDSSSSGWSLFYGDKSIRNKGHCYNGFMPGNLTDDCQGYDKYALKQKILEHEEIFKNQVYELHRLYGIQRNMMEQVKSKEVPIQATIELSSSSSLQESQVPSEDALKWHMAGFPLLNSSYGRASNSPISCTKVNNTRTGRFPYQNGSASKDTDCALDSRPFKVRKKLFDLQVPAYEYIDTQEGKKLYEQKVSDLLTYAPNGNPKRGPEKNPNGLADLNEPIHIEEAMEPLASGFLGHMSSSGDIKGIDQPAKLNEGHLGVTGGTMYVHNGSLINGSIRSEVNEKGYLTHIYEAGSSKSKLNNVPPSHQQDKLPVHAHTVQGMLNPVHHLPGIYPTGCSRKETWRDLSFEFCGKSRNYSNNGNLEPAVTSYPFFSSTRFASSSANSISSWAKPMSHERCGLNQDSGKEITKLNGFYHGSASGYKERDITRFDQFNCSRIENVASGGSISHGFFGNYKNGTFHTDSKPAKYINLNESVISQDLNGPDNHLSALPWLKPKADRDNAAAANIGRSELSHLQASSGQLSCKNGTIADLNQPFTPKCENEIRKEIDESRNVKKILGSPIFETRALNYEQSSRVSTSTGICCPREERMNRKIDINLECEPDEDIATEELTVEKEKQKERTDIRDYIDLNLCVSDCEDFSASSPSPSHESKSSHIKITVEIDLEAPFLLESENNVMKGNKIDQTCHEVLQNAAQTLFSISSSCSQIQKDETSSPESLLWFVDVVSSCANELENDEHGSSRNKCFSEDMDDFEIMTLQIEETKENDYMPIPFVPEFPKEEETGGNTPQTRSRRGQRGRQRRDFQRDILPGMVSLSRNEVTEDLQIFGGLMRATGHSWTSGLTRNGKRNRGGRGKRRGVIETVVPSITTLVCNPLMEQLNVAEARLENRSLTGWGKATRRPRRQRCAAGNVAPTAVVFS